MSREARLTRGIGVRIAHNTPVISTEDALIDRILTSATNAKLKKTTEIAQHEDLVFLQPLRRLGFSKEQSK